MRDIAPKVRLPNSHYFIAVMRGEKTRTRAIRPALLYAAIILLPILGLWCAAASLYLFFHDDLMAGLMARETRMQYAYENRLADMRNQIDRLTSQDVLDRRSIDSRMQVLLSRQAELQSHANVIATIARETGLSQFAPGAASLAPERANALNAISAVTGTSAADLPSDVSDFTEVEGRARQPASRLRVESQPDDDPAVFGPRSALDASRQTFADAASVGGSERVDRMLRPIAASIGRMEADQLAVLAALGEKAHATTSRFDVAIAEAGLSLNRFHTQAHKTGAIGGPFVPLTMTAASSAFDREVFAWQGAFATLETIKTIAPSVPFHCPFEKAVAMTSGFGPRVDPFTGRAAMHTGTDFAMDYGAAVHATAAGRVTLAGPNSGYGNMVEVDHGNGLSTRYAHLSEILVTPGQTVEAGAVVGAVGSTGRATGPHLHYETRIDGEAVDPVRFLQAGLRLYAANDQP